MTTQEQPQPKTFADLVEEATDCIQDCSLSGDEADFYLGELSRELAAEGRPESLSDLKAAVLHQLLDVLHGRHTADELRHDHAELNALTRRNIL